MNFNRVKDNYDNQLWTKAMVKTAVRKGVITPEQYKQIVGEDYVENS